jgi:hypothetical protein
MCGKSAGNRILRSTVSGAAIGAGIGAFKGFVAGEIFGGELSLGATGFLGAATGAVIQGTVGGINGFITGTALAAECNALFMYDN